MRRLRYLLRSLLHAGATRGWLDYLTCNREMARLYRAMPHLADKWHRDYLRADLDLDERLRVLRHHYDFLLRQPAGRRLVDAIEQRLPLARFQGKQGERFSLVADTDSGRTKEGEIVINLMAGTERVCLVAGTFVPDGRRTLLFIGCMQGPWNHLGNEAVKAATKAMHGLRPRDAMFHIIQLVAGVYGAEGIVGVGSLRHVYRARRQTRHRVADDYYDRLWTDLGGRRRPDGDFELPVVSARRAIEEYPSHKRAEARRRHALKEEIDAGVAAFFRGEAECGAKAGVCAG